MYIEWEIVTQTHIHIQTYKHTFIHIYTPRNIPPNIHLHEYTEIYAYKCTRTSIHIYEKRHKREIFYKNYIYVYINLRYHKYIWAEKLENNSDIYTYIQKYNQYAT